MEKLKFINNISKIATIFIVLIFVISSVTLSSYADEVVPADNVSETQAGDEVNESQEGESDDEEEEQVYTIGVERFSKFEENSEAFKENLLGIGKVVFGFVVFASIIWIGISTIIKNQDPKARALVMDKFKHIIIGVLAFSIIGVIIAVAADFQQDALENLYDLEYEQITSPEAFDTELEGNWFANIIEILFKLIGKILEYIIECMMHILTLSGNGPLGGSENNPYELNNILFLNNLNDVIDLDYEDANGVKLTTAPFTTLEWDRYTVAYIVLSGLAIPLMLIALVKLAFGYVLSAGNYEKVAEAKSTILRICIAIVFILVGPYLFRLILTLFNSLVFLIPIETSFDIGIQTIDHANGLLAVLSTLWWLFIEFKICLVFVVREIMLTVMYISIPIIAGTWAISNKFRAMNLWMGETLTNAATQFCYALVFFMATIILHGGQTNAFFTLVWLSMMIKLADFFKDSLQGLMSKWGGLDESAVAEGMSGRISKWGSSMGMGLTNFVDPEGLSGPTRFTKNAFNLFAAKGDITKVKSRSLAYKESAEGTVKSGIADLERANTFRGSKVYQDALNTPEGKRLEELYSERRNLEHEKTVLYNIGRDENDNPLYDPRLIMIKDKRLKECNSEIDQIVNMTRNGDFTVCIDPIKHAEDLQGAAMAKLNEGLPNVAVAKETHRYGSAGGYFDFIRASKITGDVKTCTDVLGIKAGMPGPFEQRAIVKKENARRDNERSLRKRDLENCTEIIDGNAYTMGSQLAIMNTERIKSDIVTKRLEEAKKIDPNAEVSTYVSREEINAKGTSIGRDLYNRKDEAETAIHRTDMSQSSGFDEVQRREIAMLKNNAIRDYAKEISRNVENGILMPGANEQIVKDLNKITSKFDMNLDSEQTKEFMRYKTIASKIDGKTSLDNNHKNNVVEPTSNSNEVFEKKVDIKKTDEREMTRAEMKQNAPAIKDNDTTPYVDTTRKNIIKKPSKQMNLDNKNNDDNKKK